MRYGAAKVHCSKNNSEHDGYNLTASVLLILAVPSFRDTLNHEAAARVEGCSVQALGGPEKCARSGACENGEFELRFFGFGKKFDIVAVFELFVAVGVDNLDGMQRLLSVPSTLSIRLQLLDHSALERDAQQRAHAHHDWQAAEQNECQLPAPVKRERVAYQE